MADAERARIDDQGIDVRETLERRSADGDLGDRRVEDALDGPYDVLIEATGTTIGDAEPAFSHVEHALERDRHVALANKGPVAERYAEVRAAEAASDGEVRFEATVGGSIPVLSTIRDIGPENVSRVHGVFNGLANFVLSRMTAEGLGYEHVLAEAQDLGLAEMDPSFDVEGTDTGLTCSVLANVMEQSGTEWTLADVAVEGITDIPGSALGLAHEEGRTVRLIGEIRESQVRVAPRLVPETSPLAVRGATTVIQITSEHAGSLNVSGAGTAASEIAAAVLTDVNRLDG
jgi:homoserine dehydrogenase